MICRGFDGSHSRSASDATCSSEAKLATENKLHTLSSTSLAEVGLSSTATLLSLLITIVLQEALELYFIQKRCHCKHITSEQPSTGCALAFAQVRGTLIVLSLGFWNETALAMQSCLQVEKTALVSCVSTVTTPAFVGEVRTYTPYDANCFLHNRPFPGAALTAHRSACRNQERFDFSKVRVFCILYLL